MMPTRNAIDGHQRQRRQDHRNALENLADTACKNVESALSSSEKMPNPPKM